MSSIIQARPPAARYLRSVTQIASATPSTTQSAEPCTASGPTCQSPLAGLGKNAAGMAVTLLAPPRWFGQNAGRAGQPRSRNGRAAALMAAGSELPQRGAQAVGPGVAASDDHHVPALCRDARLASSGNGPVGCPKVLHRLV